MTPQSLLLRGLLALALAASSASSLARPLLTIGHSSEPSSIDPLFSRTGNNQAAAENIFERLVSTDPNMQTRPGLALAWRTLEPTLWEIKLRPGVTFHDDTPFTAEDVVFSLGRAPKVPNSPAPFTGAVRSIAHIDVVDPLTLRIRTKAPTPDFMEQIGLVYMLSRRAAEGKRSEDFNSGKAAVGTGPYKFLRWQPGDSLELERNEHYWGRRPDFDRVLIRYIANDAARISALLSGSVDLIDSVPPTDAKNLKDKPGYTLYQSPSARLIYLALDSSRDISPFVTDADGKPMRANPLKDVRVRQAISKMFMREPITTRLLSGAGVPAGQMVPEGLGGYASSLPAPAYDLEGARALLAQAGYPKGFGLTLHSSNDRFAGDSDLAQALAQMMARAGVRINGVVTQPYNVYAGASGKQQYSAFIFSYGNNTADSSNGLTNVLATYDKAAGTGAFNRSRYSNPELDRFLSQASQEFDPEKRDALLRRAAEAGFNDVGIVPLYFPVAFWGARNGTVMHANKLERTSMLYIQEAK
ncbi:ABC transporter substrate-binding protein [Achromobacter seleniivolatilans]|uniref:ABC transporter substrate-binding protein n=1 Tax=Achromobacter seleniivolatilans TaxID=3047478 RepID=A0ABY9M9H3_9BURK|nr:ABC transporter substrate-binding protein [Achromobacter sp. R39]WMD22843.1 ABC transporter substrate-binding protein [Achromobacter sp. R39]